MSQWADKLEKKAKGLIAEAAEEITAAEGVDTVHLNEADETEQD